MHGDSWQLGVRSPGNDQLGGPDDRAYSSHSHRRPSPARVRPQPPSPLGRGQRWVPGGVIDLSVTLGDADIHLESEPSGTFSRNRASDRTAIEGAGAGSPCKSGMGRTGTDDGACWCWPALLTSGSRRMSSGPTATGLTHQGIPRAQCILGKQARADDRFCTCVNPCHEHHAAMVTNTASPVAKNSRTPVALPIAMS